MQDNSRGYFQPQQAREVAEAFARHGVEYLFIGKSAAILLGYPSSTQDVDIFAQKSTENGNAIVAALKELGFDLDETTVQEIIRGKDFNQLKNGPFDLDIIFAPDGIENFDTAKARMIELEGFPIANLIDIIASKKASGREKDKLDLPLLEDFRSVFEKRLVREPRSAIDVALDKLNISDQ